MIAIVILGLGLLTVAAMFPIAWTKARDMAEFNNQQAITASAESTVTLVANVAGPAAVLPGASSFKGDPVTGRPADPWVHPLHMANILATNPDPGTFDVAYVGDFEDAINATPPNSDFELNPEDSHTPLPWVQVEFRERLYPPMPPLPDEASLPVQQYEAELDRWYTLLSQRRFCWGAFHKLDYDPYAPVAEQPNPAEPRSFTFYFVTLRRGQATHRYARQDVGPPASPLVPVFVTPPAMAMPPPFVPDALRATEDVLFPVPWRVQIEIVQPPPAPTGVPTQAITNSANYPTSPLVTEMIQRGSFLIDEISGMVFRVTGREADPTAPSPRALLTIDQEIPLKHKKDPTGKILVPGLDLDDSDSLEVGDPLNEALRIFWVYPPPAERDSNGDVIGFAGPQPVVGIEVRRMTFSP